MSQRSCLVYFKEEGVFLIGRRPAERGGGWYVDDGPVLRLRPDPGPAELGDAVQSVLDAAPEDPSRREADPMIARVWRAGCWGWSGLECDSRSFTVNGGPQVEITPFALDESKGLTWDEATARCDLEPETIGRVLLERLPLCAASEPLVPPRPGRRYRERPQDLELGWLPASPAEIPARFGYKIEWLVLDTEDTGAVVAALGLKNVERTPGWTVDPYTNPKSVLVAPPVLGWTLAVGRVRPGVHEPAFLDFLASLSRTFGEAQYYGNHRVVSFVAWARAIGGRIERAYGWADGRLYFDVGDLTPEEEAVRRRRLEEMKRSALYEPEELESLASDFGLMAGEGEVLDIASRWSIHPEQLDAYPSRGPGFIGDWP